MSLGPQAERDQNFSAIPWHRQEIKPKTAREDIHLDPVAEADVYVQQIGRLKAENATLQAQLQRAMKELKAYQLQYPSAVVAQSDNRPDDGILPPWVLSPEAMTPLLQAYDTRIAELEHTIEQQKRELQGMTMRAEQLVLENESMRQKQLQDLSDIGADGQPRARKHVNALVDEMNRELNDRVEVLMGENSILIEQVTILQQELQTSQQQSASVEQDRQELSKYLKDATIQIGQLEQQLKTVTEEKRNCEARLVQLSNTHGELESSHQDKVSQLHAAQDKIGVLEAEVQELQRELREIGQRYDGESHERYSMVKAAEERIRDLQSELARRTHEGDIARETAKKYKRELDATRKDAVGMVQVMEGLERQLKIYADQEQNAINIVRDANERVEKAVLLSEQAKAAEAMQRRENEQLRAEKRAEVADSAQTEFRNFDRLKQQYTAQIRQLELKVEELTAAMVDLKAERDRAVQASEFAERRSKSVLDQVEQRQAQESDAVAQLGKERQALAARLKEETERRVAMQETIRELREALDNDRFAWSAERQSVEDQLRARQLEVSTLRTDNRRLAEAMAEKRREHLSVQHGLQQRIADLTMQLKIAEDRHRDLLDQHNEKVSALEAAVRESANQLETLMMNNQRATQKIKQAHNGSLEQMEATLNQKNSVATTLTAKIQELNLQIRSLTEERQELKELLVDRQEQIEQLEQSARAYEGIVSGLSGQLSHNLEARQQQARSAARLHAELALRSSRFPIFQEESSPVSSDRSFSHHSHDPLEKESDTDPNDHADIDSAA